VPVYLEQDIAQDTARFWHGLAQQNLFDLVLIVSTVKEQVSDAASTHDLIAAELDRLGGDQTRIAVLQCEKSTRFRASQLDLAVDYARDRFSGGIDDSTRLWVGVYNADSRPQAQTFAELAEQVDTDPDVRVFQQLVDYVVPARGPGRLVAVGNSVLQTWWTLSHYTGRNSRGRTGRSVWSRTSPYSTFGHGEFVRADFLSHLGGFPDFAYADGLLLGWICRLAGEPIGLLASRDIAEVPRLGKDLFTQQTAWMRGLLNFEGTVQWCRENQILRLSEAEVRLLRAQHLAIPAAWGFSTIGVGTALAACGRRVWRRENTAYDLVVMGALVAYPVLPALLPTADQHHQAGRGRRVLGALMAWPIEGLAFWPALRSHLQGSQQAPAKTPR
jgi:hypothetical protein